MAKKWLKFNNDFRVILNAQNDFFSVSETSVLKSVLLPLEVASIAKLKQNGLPKVAYVDTYDSVVLFLPHIGVCKKDCVVVLLQNAYQLLHKRYLKDSNCALNAALAYRHALNGKYFSDKVLLNYLILASINTESNKPLEFLDGSKLTLTQISDKYVYERL